MRQVLESSYLKHKICVSGAAETGLCTPGTLQKAKELGRQIVRHNGVCVTGATTGIPYWAAIGAKEEGGISIGLSPAASEVAHIKSYKLPVDYFDLIIYTGFDYAGRNLLLTRSSDAVLIVCGRTGTLNEFTIAFEDHKPIGVLTGTGGMSDMLKDILARAGRSVNNVIFDDDPERLVTKVIKLIEAEKVVKIKPLSKKSLPPSNVLINSKPKRSRHRG